ncbi:platelet endothelial aggregation receptor 1-like [Chlorella sorokiniana]|uniref:Platelet endothelial aggregation receptor 1-like n=1 Tax=Chlorella sorokiniana TaxID=3076 RepID=A0A2P6TXD5_CHLSO|nr:platelet endothelial aggregation receptor 1-like [Chlorella sorokiniana]|eukprot:PRW58724.1 platelet endothelial aggregation receptor 1-like [Chlorella sorokiniana]
MQRRHIQRSRPCPAGSYCPTGAVRALPCPAGFFSLAQQSSCLACRAGTTSQAGYANCNISCPVGSACATSKATAAAAVQWSCPAGGYMVRATKTNKVTCLPCPANMFSATAGLSKCWACSAGLWTNGLTGQTRCWVRPLSTPPKRPTPAKQPAKSLQAAGR